MRKNDLRVAFSITGEGQDRSLGGRFQVVSGHCRLQAAKRAGLGSVICWVREMDDDTAYMELVRWNAQHAGLQALCHDPAHAGGD